MSTYELNKSRIEDVEHDVHPPLKIAISIPVIINDKDVGVRIYIGVSKFSNDNLNREADLRRIAKYLAFSYAP